MAMKYLILGDSYCSLDWPRIAEVAESYYKAYVDLGVRAAVRCLHRARKIAFLD